MKKFKIVIIGGASMTWVPKFVRDILLLEDADGSELALMDVDAGHLEVMGRLVNRMISERGRTLRVSLFSDRREALKGADLVVSTFLHGSHEAWKDDLNIILKYGIEHPKGMSVGPGGLIQGLKNIAEAVNAARDMEEICPDAWILNFTNPMQSITLGLALHSRVKSIGLCHGVHEGMLSVSRYMGIPVDEFVVKAFGINHCAWLFELKHNGQDMMPALRKRLDEIAPSLKGAWEGQEIGTREMWDVFGAFSLLADIHSIEFWPHYIHKGYKLEDISLEHNFVEKRMERRDILWERITKAADGEIPTSRAIGNTAQNNIDYTSEEKLDDLIRAIIYNKPTTLHINTLNRGSIGNLPADCCVEVPGMVDSTGAYGCAMGNLPDGLAGLLAPHAYIQKLTVAAAMEGSRELALQALCLEPMCHSLTIAECRSMLNELIDHQPQWLPNFFK